MTQTSPGTLVDLLAAFDPLVEVGIGKRSDVAAALSARGRTVTGTDIEPRSVPAGVTFVLDDVTDPDRRIYEDAEAIYALRLPPELQEPTWKLSRAVDATLLFTTLGGDPAIVPAERRTVAEGTAFVATRK